VTVAVRPHPLRASAVLVAVALAALTLALLPPPSASAQWPTWIVPAGTPLPSPARILENLPVAGAVVVASPVAPVGAARADTPLTAHQLLGDTTSTPVGDVRLDSGVASTRADEVWDSTQGERTVVALIDTGVAPIDALDGAVAGEIDFSGTGGGDGYGHGTFLAGLIAGRGDTATGVAPGTGVLSLKVADAEGTATLGTVLGALQWLYGPGRGAGIRVALLALGLEADTEAADILDRATAAVSDTGVLVVTAAGNEGPGVLTSPATSTGTFSAGAVDDQGTPDRSDDQPAAFSGTGVDRAGAVQPDLVASGVNVVGSVGTASVIWQANPGARIEEQWFRGSGTSMSAALTAGVAALAASARPDLPGAALADALRAGGGELDAVDTVAAAMGAPEHRGNAGGNGARTAPPAAGQGKAAGNANPQGVRWTGVRWTGVRWTGVRWTVVGWEGTDGAP
jgi:serine protease AprX